jgi:hypothetical protein
VNDSQYRTFQFVSLVVFLALLLWMFLLSGCVGLQAHPNARWVSVSVQKDEPQFKAERKTCFDAAMGHDDDFDRAKFFSACMAAGGWRLLEIPLKEMAD